MSDSVQPQRRQPTRLPHPWDSPGKNTGVGCHFLLQCMKVKSESEVAQSCLTSSDPMDCSLPGSSIHGIFQARVLEWGAIAFSRKTLQAHLKMRIITQPSGMITQVKGKVEGKLNRKIHLQPNFAPRNLQMGQGIKENKITITTTYQYLCLPNEETYSRSKSNDILGLKNKKKK